MTQEVVNNAIVLYRLKVSRDQVKEADRIFFLEPELQKVLSNPTVSQEKKDTVVDKVYRETDISEKITGFIKAMCKLGYSPEMRDIFDAYYRYWDQEEKVIRARLITAQKADRELVDSANATLTEKYPGYKIVLTEEVDENILGGYVIRLENMEYDRSYEGRLRQLERKLTGR